MKLDVRGLSCPQPAIELNNTLRSQPQSIEVLCNASTDINNLLHMAEENSYILSRKEEKGKEKILHFTKNT